MEGTDAIIFADALKNFPKPPFSIRHTLMQPKPLFFQMILILCIFFQSGMGVVRAQPTSGPQALLPETHFEFPPVFEGQEVYHEFVIRNKGDAPLNITDVRTG